MISFFFEINKHGFVRANGTGTSEGQMSTYFILSTTQLLRIEIYQAYFG